MPWSVESTATIRQRRSIGVKPHRSLMPFDTTRTVFTYKKCVYRHRQIAKHTSVQRERKVKGAYRIQMPRCGDCSARFSNDNTNSIQDCSQCGHSPPRPDLRAIYEAAGFSESGPGCLSALLNADGKRVSRSSSTFCEHRLHVEAVRMCRTPPLQHDALIATS